MHLSTAKQLPATLNRFFKDDPVVTILKCDYGRLSAWKVVKWEASADGDSEWLSVRMPTRQRDGIRPEPLALAAFPHLYAQLEGENVESHKELVKGEGQPSWDDALDKARQDGWLRD